MNIDGFDLNLLVVFDALLTHGSVTRAAKRVGLSQPAFSNALSRLRDRVGDRLFERRRGGMMPTPRALAMADPVRTALRELERALSRPRAAGLLERRVTIAANVYAQCVLLPRVIRLLEESSPGVRLEVRSPDATQRDAALTVDWADRGARGNSSAIVLRDALVCVTRQGYRSASMRSDFSRYDQPKFTWRALNQDFIGALCLAAQSELVATVPRRLAEWFAPRLGLQILRPAAKLPDAVLRVAWHHSDANDLAVMSIKSCVLDAGIGLAQGSGE